MQIPPAEPQLQSMPVPGPVPVPIPIPILAPIPVHIFVQVKQSQLAKRRRLLFGPLIQLVPCRFELPGRRLYVP